MHKPKPTPSTATRTEQEWEEKALTESLGDAVKPDGGIDFDKLRGTAVTMSPDELYPEGDGDDES
jgi:hypothetical protein